MRQGAAVTVVFALRDVAPINPLIETSIASGGACPHPPLQGAQPAASGCRFAGSTLASRNPRYTPSPSGEGLFLPLLGGREMENRRATPSLSRNTEEAILTFSGGEGRSASSPCAPSPTGEEAKALLLWEMGWDEGSPLRAGKRGARDSAANDAGFPPSRE